MVIYGFEGLFALSVLIMGIPFVIWFYGMMLFEIAQGIYWRLKYGPRRWTENGKQYRRFYPHEMSDDLKRAVESHDMVKRVLEERRKIEG